MVFGRFILSLVFYICLFLSIVCLDVMLDNDEGELDDNLLGFATILTAFISGTAFGILF